MDEFQQQILERYNKLSEMIIKKEKELKMMRDDRLPLSDMLDKWGVIPKTKRNKTEKTT